MKIVDGIPYEDSQAPDLKSIECTGTDDTKRYYQGLKADADVLKNVITYVGVGSSCMFLDTKQIAFFTSSGWYVVGEGVL